MLLFVEGSKGGVEGSKELELVLRYEIFRHILDYSDNKLM